MILLSLIGEQPIPNLLIHRHYKPDQHYLAFTARTQNIAARLSGMENDLQLKRITDPFNISLTLKEFRELNKPDVVNITGGTKPMALAAYELAKELQVPVVYLESETHKSMVYEYDPSGSTPLPQQPITLGRLLNIDDYLKAHKYEEKKTWDYQPTPQEIGLNRWFTEHAADLDIELKFNVPFGPMQIDFIVRRGNQVAVIEAKDQKDSSRKGLDQLNTIASRKNLGTYTGKALILSHPLAKDLQDLADAQDIHVIEVTGSSQQGYLVPDTCSEKKLRKLLDDLLGPINP